MFLFALVQGANLLAGPAVEPLKSTRPDSGNYLPRFPVQTCWEDYLQTKKGKPVDIIFIGDSITGYQGDHLHLNTQGYELWAAELNPVLSKLLGEPNREQ